MIGIGFGKSSPDGRMITDKLHLQTAEASRDLNSPFLETPNPKRINNGLFHNGENTLLEANRHI